MANPTEIIVYRNPAEKALWDFFGTPAGTYLLLAVCGLLTAGLISIVVKASWQDYKRWRRK